MKKEDVLQEQWLTYIEWWRQNVKDPENPPTEDAFWVWYALKKMAVPPEA